MGIEYGEKRSPFIDYGRPSLFLDFAKRKSLVDAISKNNLITFTRSSTATYVGSDGLIKTAAADEPRFDHDPVTGECLGLLIEEQRSNLFLNSDSPVSQIITLSDSTTYTSSFYGTGTATITTASTTVTGGELLFNSEFDTNFNNWREDGSATASVSNGILNVVTTATYKGVTQQLPTTPGKFYKATYRSRIVSGGGYTDFCYNGTDLILTMENSAAGFVVKTGYFLATLTTTSIRLRMRNAGTFEVDYARIQEVSQSTVATLTGSGAYPTRSNETFTTGTSIVDDDEYWIEVSGSVDKVQLEAGSFPTSYIPTSGSAVTRQPDNASITGTNFTDFYNQSEGTILSVHKLLGLNTGSAFQNVYSIDDGTTTNRIWLYARGGSNDIQFIGAEGFGTGFSILTGLNSPNTLYKSAGAYKTNDVAFYVDGTFYGSDNTVTPPAVTTFGIGRRNDADSRLNGHLKQLLYYPTRLTNTQLQALTQ